jgi:hypothetical protein
MTPIRRFWLYWKFSNEPKKSDIDKLCTPYLRRYHTYDIDAQLRFRQAFASKYRHLYAKKKLKELNASHCL